MVASLLTSNLSMIEKPSCSLARPDGVHSGYDGTRSCAAMVDILFLIVDKVNDEARAALRTSTNVVLEIFR